MLDTERLDGLDTLNSDTPEQELPALDIPKHERRVQTVIQDLPVETLCAKISRGALILQPEFQRNFVWNSTKASRLIESLLLNIPIPVVYVAEAPGGKQEVVDGQQRLTSISAFVAGSFPEGVNLKREFKLSGLQVLDELNGKRFVDLDVATQNLILEATLRVIVIKAESHPDVKFEVFERLNLGAEKLNDQELRNCVYRGRYNTLLARLSEYKPFLEIQGLSAPHNRMADRQLILRFFALHRLTHLHYRGNMKQVMNRELDEHRDPSDTSLKQFEELFTRSIDMAWAVFGKKAFRRFQPGTGAGANGTWEERLNFALWDTLLYTFSFYQKSDIIPHADRIYEEFLDLMTHDPTFVEYVVSTGDKAERVKYRADVWRQRMDAVVGAPRTDGRLFTRKLKESLFEQDPTCAICGQRIQSVDDAEVDHIVHYWRGGKTIPENARLTHRHCNRARGGRED
ncbi:HNH endonuclease family protein [Deinococcus hohokamensis]|uniref:HNH endonuclease family protein n=1 Tax=Deinococcus hohokamensis TaxID=309883 RepID=A0ABV9I8B7_9DEIO